MTAQESTSQESNHTVASRFRLSRIVTLASATGQYGGPYDTARRQARLIAMAGGDVTLVAAHLPGDAPTEDMFPGLTYRVVPARRLLTRKGYTTVISLRAVRALWSEVGRSDVVHISFAREFVPMLGALFCVLRKTKWVAQPHGMLTSRYSALHATVDVVVMRILKKADAIVALTSDEELDIKKLARFDGTAFITLGNPLPENLPATPSPSPGRDVAQVVFIARLHPRKRVDDFIDAARHSAAMSWSEDYQVIGPDGGELHKVLQGEQEVHNLHYQGAVNAHEVVDRLVEASVFVLCSEREPWGNVLVTALALGVPVVVTESAALAGEIRRANAGIVVPDREPTAIAAAVHEIASNHELAQVMSENGRDYAKQHLSTESQLSAIKQLYRTVAT